MKNIITEHNNEQLLWHEETTNLESPYDREKELLDAIKNDTADYNDLSEEEKTEEEHKVVEEEYLDHNKKLPKRNKVKRTKHTQDIYEAIY